MAVRSKRIQTLADPKRSAAIRRWHARSISCLNGIVAIFGARGQARDALLLPLVNAFEIICATFLGRLDGHIERGGEKLGHGNRLLRQRLYALRQLRLTIAPATFAILVGDLYRQTLPWAAQQSCAQRTLRAVQAIEQLCIILDRGSPPQHTHPRDERQLHVVRGLAAALSISMRSRSQTASQVDAKLIGLIRPAGSRLGVKLGPRTIENWRARYRRAMTGTYRSRGHFFRSSGELVLELDTTVFDHTLAMLQHLDEADRASVVEELHALLVDNVRALANMQDS